MLTADQCEEIKEKARSLLPSLQWGTVGPNLDQALKQVPLCELSTPHLENIIISLDYVNVCYKAAILQILQERYRKGDLKEM